MKCIGFGLVRFGAIGLIMDVCFIRLYTYQVKSYSPDHMVYSAVVQGSGIGNLGHLEFKAVTLNAGIGLFLLHSFTAKQAGASASTVIPLKANHMLPTCIPCVYHIQRTRSSICSEKRHSSASKARSSRPP